MTHQHVLKIAAAYNLIFGFITLLFPEASLTWAGMEAPRYPQIWQCLGMVIGVYGVGYWIASWDPTRHWPIVLVGFLGKIFGPIGFVWNAAQGLMPWSLGWMIITNDLIWWLPFGSILWAAWGESQRTASGQIWLTAAEAMSSAETRSGKTLAVLSAEKPTLLIFLRHLGCTFCMETLHDLGKIPTSQRQHLHTVLVSMGPEEPLRELLQEHGVEDVDLLIDPEQQVYRAFNLARGSFSQLFGVQSFTRGFAALRQKGIGIGSLSGDGLQMPGTFVLRDGNIVRQQRARVAAETPDFDTLLKDLS